MKTLTFLLSVLLLIGCSNSSENGEVSQPIETESRKCAGTISDFLRLQRKELQDDLLAKIDSTRKVQYPDNDQEASIMVDLTAEYLTRFLNDIEIDTFTQNRRFEKEYHFNSAPEGYSDPAECKDKIVVSFDDQNCSFRLDIHNTFLVEPSWCTESLVVYGFKINSSKVTGFWRQEAG